MLERKPRAAGHGRHLKVIGHVADALPLLEAASVEADAGVVPVSNEKSISAFIRTASNGRVWEREPTLRSIG